MEEIERELLGGMEDEEGYRIMNKEQGILNNE
jgi:hypothetical protein